MEQFVQRREKFNNFVKEKQIPIVNRELSFTCPCCGFPSLSQRGKNEICILCNWGDNGFDAEDVHENGPKEEARNEFQRKLDQGFLWPDQHDLVQEFHRLVDSPADKANGPILRIRAIYLDFFGRLDKK